MDVLCAGVGMGSLAGGACDDKGTTLAPSSPRTKSDGCRDHCQPPRLPVLQHAGASGVRQPSMVRSTGDAMLAQRCCHMVGILPAVAVHNGAWHLQLLLALLGLTLPSARAPCRSLEKAEDVGEGGSKRAVVWPSQQLQVAHCRAVWKEARDMIRRAV